MSDQKYAFVTGASSGIGYALTESFSKRGYKVFASAPKSELPALKPLKDKYGAIIFDCDITSLEDIIKAKKLVQQTNGGRVDILYNNAGMATGGPSADIDERLLDKIFQVNVLGHINVTKHFIDYVIPYKGTIVFTSSVASIIPLPWSAAYNATKAAINMYAKNLHYEMKPFGVSVHSVITGGVDTHITDDAPSHYESKWFSSEGMEDTIKACKNMTKDPSQTEQPDVYAEGIANMVTKKNSKFNLYKGGKSYTIYLVTLLIPLSIIQFFLGFHFKQNKVLSATRKKVLANDSRKLK
ncbi:NADPH-dependent 1-acyldihydroxyacetone phosphate reductase [[Candida] jaroonii]|uniref:NADPH-dependent 1-acyldihydroxyacetone phosphate reductase n=1 Tax=[Candida] jaroonii TaxID=467808 RepID=A0ACA9Y037_9ASCO|nr:NADPH-dependent 1-acyldihydroxyacetone phosphate reductase [[Candida] jaroonii]